MQHTRKVGYIIKKYSYINQSHVYTDVEKFYVYTNRAYDIVLPINGLNKYPRLNNYLTHYRNPPSKSFLFIQNNP